MHPFFKPKRALTASPEATPYQRAGQVWDDRMGLSIAHARNWRRIALANLALAAFLGAGWWVQADRAVVRPFVVEVSDWGQTQRITALDGRYEPTEAQTGYALAQWIRDVRSKSIDPIVIRQNWLRAYDLLTPKASAFLNDWAQANDPFAEAGREAGRRRLWSFSPTQAALRPRRRNPPRSTPGPTPSLSSPADMQC